VAFCSDQCRAEFGTHGEIRLDRSAHNTGVVDATTTTGRHGGRTVEHNAEQLADLLGMYDVVRRAGVVVFDVDDDNAPVDVFKRELDRNLYAERKTAHKAGCVAVSVLYDLGGGATVGRTVAGSHVDRVTGQKDVTADWQERLDAAAAWLCDAV